MSNKYNDPINIERRRKFQELVDSSPPIFPCKFCGRVVMAGVCCKAAKDESIALYKANTPLKTRIKHKFYRMLYMFHPNYW